MKKNKMSLTTELDLTREGTAEMTRWCILIALHQSFGIGAARLNKILARAEKLGQESLDVAMTVNDRGMPSTDRSLALRRSWMPEGVDPDFRVPVLHSPRTRRQEQLRMAGNVAASMVWTLCAEACIEELGFGAVRLNRRAGCAEGRHRGGESAGRRPGPAERAGLRGAEAGVFEAGRDAAAGAKSRKRQSVGAERKEAGRKGCGCDGAVKGEYMGKANLYTVKDYQTGEVLAKGTAGELEASGIVPKGYHTSEWAKHENQKRRNRKYAVTFEERQPEVKRGEKGRMMSVYTCYNAAGDVIGEGTARELWEAGVFSNDNAAYYTYKEQGGRCIKRGIAKMTCRKEMRKVGQNNARGEKADCAAKKPERPVLRKIKDPTPLDYDVHDLILYNAIARKEGRPELTYGYWAAAGKPARP